MADSVGEVISQLIAESKNYVAGLRTATSSLEDWGLAVEGAFEGIEKAAKTFSGKMDSLFSGVDDVLEVFRQSSAVSLQGISTSFKDLKTDTDSAFKSISKSTKEFSGVTDEALRDLSRNLRNLGKNVGAPIKAFKALNDETKTALAGVTKSTHDFNSSTGAALKELNENLKVFSKEITKHLETVRTKQKEVAEEGGGAFSRLGGSIVNFKNAAIAAITAVVTSRLITWLGDLIDKAEEFDAATRGLKAVASITEESFDELSGAAKEIAAKGLISFEGAAKGIKNFVLMGLTVDQAKQALIRFIEQAILFGSSRKNLESNVLQATDAFRTQNDEVLKNIGIMSGFSGLLAKAGVTAEMLADKTTKANAATAIFNALMQETAGSSGLAEQAAQGWSGAAGQLTVSLDGLKVLLGQIIEGGLLPFLQAVVPIVERIREWLDTNRELLEVRLTSALEEWSTRLIEFAKNLNPEKVKAFALEVAAAAQRLRIAFNVVTIAGRTILFVFQMLSGGVLLIIAQLQRLGETLGHVFKFLAALENPTQWSSGWDEFKAGMKDSWTQANTLEKAVGKIFESADKNALAIGQDFKDIGDASREVIALEAQAQAAHEAGLKANADAAEKAKAATEEQIKSEAARAEFMRIATTEGIEAASKWEIARRTAEENVRTQVAETNKAIDGQIQKEADRKTAVEETVPAVQRLTSEFKSQRSEVDALNKAIQAYAHSLGTVVHVSGGPGGGSEKAYPQNVDTKGGSNLTVKVETDWPTVSREVSEEQQRLQLQGFRPGD